ncbi:hypothetical protein L1049_022445 [Liquidambar formosana]|uniref:Lipoyl-binding domain-containing protein n=1 Tax=Liquidambar formosana TaxID=63359 RepID=A0AAP0WP23_LIQFO
MLTNNGRDWNWGRGGGRGRGWGYRGDVVYVELLKVGAAIIQGSSFGVVDSIKATSDINSSISGKVVEVNKELNNSPGLVIHLMYIIACDTD